MISACNIAKIANGWLVMTPPEESKISGVVKPGMEIFCSDEHAVMSVVRSTMNAIDNASSAVSTEKIRKIYDNIKS